MSTEAHLRRAAENTVTLVTRALRDERAQLAELRDLHAVNRENMKNVVGELQVIERRSGASLTRFIPIIAARREKRIRAELQAVLDEKTRLLSESAVLRRGADDCISAIRRLKTIGKMVQATKTRWPQRLPKQFEAQIETLANSTEFLRRSQRQDTTDAAIKAGKQYHHLWKKVVAEHSKRATAKPSISQGILSEEEMARASKHRIYLPIPHSLRKKALQMGAQTDPSSRNGSKLYVTLDQDLEAFENMLPLAYRTQALEYRFPPIRSNAVGQNLWSLFSRETWDHIRSMAYERSGRRCMICGNQRGFMLDQIEPPEQRKRGPVDCHEVWEWEAPDGEVGVQRLKELLVLCRDCHMMFHEGKALDLGRQAGREDEVREFIERRKLFATRLDPRELASRMEQDHADWRSNTAVGTWIIDLTRLGQQDYMTYHTPVMRVDNDADVAPNMVAGLSFETDDGLFYEAREAEEIYRDFLTERTASITA